MRWPVLALVVAVAMPMTASADRADDLVIAGQELAKAGRFDEAIAKFREADAVHPSALHACLIGLAHLRAGRLDDAARELAACRRRSTASDPVPEWLPAEERRLEAERARAAQQQPPPPPPPSPPPPPHVVPARRAIAPKLWLAGGAGLAVIGAAVHVGVVRPARADLAAATTPDQYDDRYGRYNAARIATIGLYALGGAAAAVGVVLYRRTPEGAVVGARPAPGGGLVTLEWRR